MSTGGGSRSLDRLPSGAGNIVDNLGGVVHNEYMEMDTTCECGCGATVTQDGTRGPARRYATTTCRNRALRARKAAAGQARKAPWAPGTSPSGQR
mgnify:CR=1 FL=1